MRAEKRAELAMRWLIPTLLPSRYQSVVEAAAASGVDTQEATVEAMAVDTEATLVLTLTPALTPTAAVADTAPLLALEADMVLPQTTLLATPTAAAVVTLMAHLEMHTVVVTATVVVDVARLLLVAALMGTTDLPVEATTVA